ncbi:hypothetical protein LC612_39165 [Nostoc sp. CHAB 5834]|nr:hypothetical protein [Nostoc sp. CHAB 5834]
MKRSQRVTILQEALQGKTGQLHQLHQQRSEKAMPYLEAHGIIDYGQCPPMLLDLPIYYGEVDEKFHQTTLGQWMTKPNSERTTDVCGFIDMPDSQYDTLPLSFIELRCRDYSKTLIQGGTIGDLRRYFSQCTASVNEPFVVLLFKTNLTRYTSKFNPA